MLKRLAIVKWIGENWKLIAIGILLIVVAVFVHHYDSLKTDRDRYKDQVASQQAVIADAAAAIQDWKKFMTDTQHVLDEMKANQVAAETEKRRINEILAKHDLAELAKRKPGLVEVRINSGSRDMLEQLQYCSQRANPKCRASSGEGKATGS